MNADKKRILIIFTGALEIGGIERSLIGLLDALDYSRYEVDLFLYSHHGELFSLINPCVEVLPEVKELAYLRTSFWRNLKHGCLYPAALRVRDEIRSKVFSMDIDRDHTWGEIMRSRVSALQKHYDLAIGFFRPFDMLKEKVDASVKIGWIHTDYSSIDGRQKLLLKKDYSDLDQIIAVSESCKRAFLTVFPEFVDYTQVIENILSETFIKEQAEQFMVNGEMPSDGSVKLLSIGRFCYAKNFDNVPDICKKILDSGINATWYLIGYGPDEKRIRSAIQDNHMENRVIILGKKDNPYPYIKRCDIYVQPSRYEGNSVSVREAQILCKPVVITNYNTASSQLIDHVDGILAPKDNKGIADTIVRLCQNLDERRHLVEECSKRDYSRRSEVEKLVELIG